jgi:hypothetical protein
MEDATDREALCTLEAGRSTSLGSYGQLSETVVVNGMKKFSNETNGLIVQSLSRNLGLDVN